MSLLGNKNQNTELSFEEKLLKDLSQLFHLPPNQIPEELSMTTCESWDSLKHMELISLLEQTFEIELSFEEIVEMKNLQSIRTILKKKLFE